MGAIVSNLVAVGGKHDLQIVAEDRGQRKCTLRDRVAEPRGVTEGREAQHVEIGQQCAIHVAGTTQILNLSISPIGILPVRRVRCRVVRRPRRGSRHIAVNRHVERV